MPKYVKRKEVLDVLKVHYQTLYRMETRGEIEVIRSGTHRLYNLEKYLKDNSQQDRLNICYCRVSSRKQKADLKRQIQMMKSNYPNYEIISDIGSGINMNRPGLKRIIDLSIEGKISEVVIAYKDRLMRIGYELIEHIIETYSNGKITIIDRGDKESPAPAPERDA